MHDRQDQQFEISLKLCILVLHTEYLSIFDDTLGFNSVLFARNL